MSTNKTLTTARTVTKHKDENTTSITSFFIMIQMLIYIKQIKNSIIDLKMIVGFKVVPFALQHDYHHDA